MRSTNPEFASGFSDEYPHCSTDLDLKSDVSVSEMGHDTGVLTVRWQRLNLRPWLSLSSRG